MCRKLPGASTPDAESANESPLQTWQCADRVPSSSSSIDMHTEMYVCARVYVVRLTDMYST